MDEYNDGAQICACAYLLLFVVLFSNVLPFTFGGCSTFPFFCPHIPLISPFWFSMLHMFFYLVVLPFSQLSCSHIFRIFPFWFSMSFFWFW